MKILITGGAGFVGSHLCRRLLSEGHHVICVDNLFTGHRSNVGDLLENPKFEFIRHDVVESLWLEAEQIYHLACPASPVHYQFNSIKTAKTSFLGTYNMLGMAKRLKSRFLLASTSEVYGDPEVHPQPESYWGHVNSVGIRSCYDEGKRIAETITMDYFRQHQTDVRIARIFNTYGPQMDPRDGRVVSNFVVQALKNQPITIYGKGDQTRSFCFVSDLVEGLVKLMNQTQTLGPVNLGNPGEFTILQLAQEVLKLIPESKSQIEYMPLPQDDPRQRKPDITLAKKYLQWEPTISLQSGLLPTIEYFRERIKEG
jgi:UDP-glucuronate decarboxylase